MGRSNITRRILKGPGKGILVKDKRVSKAINERLLTGYEEEEERTRQHQEEISITSDTTGRLVVFRMQSVQQCTCHEILGPNHASRPHQEPPAQPSKTETRELCGDNQKSTEPIIYPNVVVELHYDDGIEGVWRTDGHVCHDVDEDMLLDVPRARVE